MNYPHLERIQLPPVITAGNAKLPSGRKPSCENSPEIAAVPVNPWRAFGLPAANRVGEWRGAADDRNLVAGGTNEGGIVVANNSPTKPLHMAGDTFEQCKFEFLQIRWDEKGAICWIDHGCL